MKKTVITLLLITIFCGVNAQTSLTETEIKQKCDSILEEANTLYKYEKAAWITSDMAMDKKEIKKDFGGLLIYQRNDTISAVVLAKEGTKCIYEVTFKNSFNNPCKESLIVRDLTEVEKSLQQIKKKMFKEVTSDEKYQVNCPQGYNINMELIPYELGYKLYFILGTNQSKLIPFGNDYVFFGDKKGDVTSWRKIHSRLIFSPTEYEGNKVTGLSHSHLKTEPFISATDICTFKLYGSLYELNEFEVLSTGLRKYFKYKLIENEIETRDM